MTETIKRRKSDVVKEILKTNPSASVAEVVAKAADEGTKITSGLVYQLRKKKKSKISKRKYRQRILPSQNGHVSLNGNAIESIKKVKKLADEVGGINALGELVELVVTLAR